MAVRSTLMGAVVGVTATVTLIAGLELIARLLPHAAPLSTAGGTQVDRDLPVLTTLADLRTPNQRGIYLGALYTTNSQGLRSPEIPLTKPPGTFRVAVLGDSVSMGAGVTNEATYAALLEQALPSFRPGRYEVLNLALSGLNTKYVVQSYIDLGLKQAPDLAIYGFTLNDIEGPRYQSFVVPIADRYGLTSSRFALWRIIGPGIVAFREAFFPPRNGYVNELRFNYLRNEAAWRDVTEQLDRLKKINDPRGICTVVFIHSHLATLNILHPFRDLYDKVADAARERGFYVVQSLPAFLGLDDQSLWVNRYDAHPNPEGHQLLAGALIGGLKDLPARCWE